MFRLGGVVFVKADDPVEYADWHVRNRFRAAFCPEIPLFDGPRIKAFREAFAKRDITLAETGVWGRNFLSPDEQERCKAIADISESLALADEVGARCCVTYAGSVRPGAGAVKENLSSDTFDRIVETARAIIRSVKPKNAKFSLEMMQLVFPESVESYVRLFRAIASPHFGVHMDPVNILTSPALYFENAAVIRDCFDRLGPWIVSCHAKDIIIQGGLALHLNETVPGMGVLDYREYIKGIDALNRNVPLMIEHLKNTEESDQARDYILGIAAELGITQPDDAIANSE
jgi:sugar phosphate isomerase/epimerase